MIYKGFNVIISPNDKTHIHYHIGPFLVLWVYLSLVVLSGKQSYL
jgi:hypothetical protein